MRASAPSHASSLSAEQLARVNACMHRRYNEKIAHETVRVAVCDVMDDTIERRLVSANGATSMFADTRKQAGSS